MFKVFLKEGIWAAGRNDYTMPEYAFEKACHKKAPNEFISELLDCLKNCANPSWWTAARFG